MFARFNSLAGADKDAAPGDGKAIATPFDELRMEYDPPSPSLTGREREHLASCARRKVNMTSLASSSTACLPALTRISSYSSSRFRYWPSQS